MIIVDILECLRVLTILNKYFEDQFELDDDQRSPNARGFFRIRQSILSYLICRDALTDAYTQVPDELEESLVVIQDIYNEIYSERPEIYFTKQDKILA